VSDVAAVANDDTAVACAAYAAAAGLNAQVNLTGAATIGHRVECEAYGARRGTAAEHDPYRIEGLKTVAYEILEQSDWTAPAAIVCPGEDGVLAVKKALEEMAELGWIRAGVSQVVSAPEVPLYEALELGLELAAAEAILPSPAGAECLAAARDHRGSVVVINPASGSRYAALYARRLPNLYRTAETDKLGGLITPR
jgi:threonine synthase